MTQQLQAYIKLAEETILAQERRIVNLEEKLTRMNWRIEYLEDLLTKVKQKD